VLQSLCACAAGLGVPMLIYEAGEALRFDEISIRAGLRGILNVMRLIGMLPEARRSRRVEPVLARATSWVRAPASGIVSDKMKLGSRVKKGQRLASISDPLGDEEESAITPFDGIVIGRCNLPLAHQGDALFNLAAFESVTQVEGLMEEFTATHDLEPRTDG